MHPNLMNNLRLEDFIQNFCIKLVLLVNIPIIFFIHEKTELIRQKYELPI